MGVGSRSSLQTGSPPESSLAGEGMWGKRAVSMCGYMALLRRQNNFQVRLPSSGTEWQPPQAHLLPVAAVLRADQTGRPAGRAGELSKHSTTTTTLAGLAIVEGSVALVALHGASFPNSLL